MIRKLRTQRDNQQWMLDLALNMRGRVQNFERDDLEVPSGKRARNYRMLPKVFELAGPPGQRMYVLLAGFAAAVGQLGVQSSWLARRPGGRPRAGCW